MLSVVMVVVHRRTKALEGYPVETAKVDAFRCPVKDVHQKVVEYSKESRGSVVLCDPYLEFEVLDNQGSSLLYAKPTANGQISWGI